MTLRDGGYEPVVMVAAAVVAVVGPHYGGYGGANIKDDRSMWYNLYILVMQIQLFCSTACMDNIRLCRIVAVTRSRRG